MTSHSAPPRASGLDDGTAEGRVYTVSGQDWDQLVAAADQAADTPGTGHMVINMGPQHPSTHGVLRLILTLEGETVTECRVGIGYLHTGIEKNMEYRTWTQGVTFCTRADYLMPIFNETSYCLSVERLLRHRGQDPRPGEHHPGADDGAQPDRLAPRRPRAVRPRAGRDHDLHAGRADAGERARPDGADHRAADEPRLHPARRGRPGPAARRAGEDPRVPPRGTRGGPATCAS